MPAALCRSLAVLALLVAAPGSLLAQTAALSRQSVTLATATPGGGFPVYGETFAATVNRFEPALDVRCRNTRGSTENVPLLKAGEVDIALVQGEVVQQALAGDARQPAGLKIIAAMYSTAGMFVVRADSPYHTIHDLVGKPVAFGASGSGLVILSRYVLDGIGLDQDRDFKAIYLEHAGDGPAMVEDGRAAALWGGGLGWPGFLAVARSQPGARFIAPDAREIARILSKHPFLRPLTLPAGSYPGQGAAIRSVGSWSFVLARPDLPDDIAYRLVRALHRGEAFMAARLPQAAETTSAHTVAAAPDRQSIHPGALRYFGEIGLLK